MRLDVCSTLPTRLLTGTWFRATTNQYLSKLLQTSYSRGKASRFYHGQVKTKLPEYETLYLAQNQFVALKEVEALLGSQEGGLVANPEQAWHLQPIEVQLQRVVDLTEQSAQEQLETSVQEITGDWKAYSPRLAPTQNLGLALFQRKPRIEGFLVASARVPTSSNLIVFPLRLLRKSLVRYRFTDLDGKQHERSIGGKKPTSKPGI